MEIIDAQLRRHDGPNRAAIRLEAKRKAAGNHNEITGKCKEEVQGGEEEGEEGGGERNTDRRFIEN